MRIIAVSGGKGGIGKTILSSNLAVALARTGDRTLLVDLDLGGANVNTYFGFMGTHKTLKHYFERTAELSELFLATPQANLCIVSAAGDSPELANPKYQQKVKLIKDIRKLDFDNVVLDLGAGTRFDTLDFYLTASRHVLITTTDITSLFNVYGFIKSAVIRLLERTLKAEFKIDNISPATVLTESLERGCAFMELFLENLSAVSVEASAHVAERLNKLNWYLITNRLDTTQSMDAHMALNNLCKKHLGFFLKNGGELAGDRNIQLSVNKMEPFMLTNPMSASGRVITNLALNLREEQ